MSLPFRTCAPRLPLRPAPRGAAGLEETLAAPARPANGDELSLGATGSASARKEQPMTRSTWPLLACALALTGARALADGQGDDVDARGRHFVRRNGRDFHVLGRP